MTFKPGQSGNPAGRPRGSVNKRTILAERVLDDRAGEVTDAAIDLAKNGHATALRVCMDRVSAPLRHRVLDFELPEVKSAADAVVAANAILQGVAHGELTIPEAAGLMKLVRAVASLAAAADREKQKMPLDAQDSDDATLQPERDAVLDDDDQMIPAQRPVAATTTEETTQRPPTTPIAPSLRRAPGPVIALRNSRRYGEDADSDASHALDTFEPATRNGVRSRTSPARTEASPSW